MKLYSITTSPLLSKHFNVEPVPTKWLSNKTSFSLLYISILYAVSILFFISCTVFSVLLSPYIRFPFTSRSVNFISSDRFTTFIFTFFSILFSSVFTIISVSPSSFAVIFPWLSTSTILLF